MQFLVTFDPTPDVTPADLRHGVALLLEDFFDDCPFLVTKTITVEHVPDPTTEGA
jgi:hypothetical protein